MFWVDCGGSVKEAKRQFLREKHIVPSRHQECDRRKPTRPAINTDADDSSRVPKRELACTARDKQLLRCQSDGRCGKLRNH